MALSDFKYRISSNSSRASNKRRASNTGRGSEPFVPTDAGLRINAGPRIQAGSQIEARYSCTQYCTASVLLVFVYPVLYSRYIVGIRVLSTVQPVYCWYSCTVQRGSEPLVLIDAGPRINAGPRIQAGGPSRLYQ